MWYHLLEFVETFKYSLLTSPIHAVNLRRTRIPPCEIGEKRSINHWIEQTKKVKTKKWLDLICCTEELRKKHDTFCWKVLKERREHKKLIPSRPPILMASITAIWHNLLDLKQHLVHLTEYNLDDLSWRIIIWWRAILKIRMLFPLKYSGMS